MHRAAAERWVEYDPSWDYSRRRRGRPGRRTAVEDLIEGMALERRRAIANQRELHLSNPNKFGNRGIVCKYWLRGLCKEGDGCDFLHRHDSTRMPRCQFFDKDQQCARGEECDFLHQAPVPECRRFNSGFCPLGPNCPLYHRQRLVACPNYIRGFCRKGPMCLLPHPHFPSSTSLVHMPLIYPPHPPVPLPSAEGGPRSGSKRDAAAAAAVAEEDKQNHYIRSTSSASGKAVLRFGPGPAALPPPPTPTLLPRHRHTTGAEIPRGMQYQEEFFLSTTPHPTTSLRSFASSSSSTPFY